MLTLAPLPTWKNLFHLLFRRPLSNTELVKPWHREGDIAGWLSRSAWSIALIALWRQKQTPEKQITVWIPDFFCNTSLAALRQTGTKFIFYPLNDKMEPDISACKKLTESDKPDLFLLVHYFGKPAPTSDVLNFCSTHRTWLIEDAAHVLRPIKDIGERGDFVLYSPHKHLPIPNGSVLVIRSEGPAQLNPDIIESFGLPNSWPNQLNALQQELRISKNAGCRLIFVWFIKRVLQKLEIRNWRQSKTPFNESVNPTQILSTQLGSPALSNVSQRLLTNLTSKIETVARQRQRNQLLWDDLLMNNQNHLLSGERPRQREWTPYLATYRADSNTAEKLYQDWQQRGLPVNTWPDLPPEVTMNQEHHNKAWNLRHSFLYLPVHQSLNSHNLLKVFHIPKTTQNNSLIKLVWDHATKEQWQKWLKQVGRSNLLQSWEYGEAKVESGWKAKRGVFYLDNEPIAFVQLLEKRLLKFFTISRINRGPLYLRNLNQDQLESIWNTLAKLGNICKGKLLTVAPELMLTGNALTMMEKLGFRQFYLCFWESIWLDLNLDLEKLRKNLNGKWRNMLAFSEKALLKLESGSNDKLFDWMMEKYKELMQEKNFTGTPIDLIKSLRKYRSHAQPLVILRALHDEEPAAGICLAQHGTSVTYLVGWNGNKGRSLKANQYLLWNAIVHLKKSGVRWFDLGGINEEQTPSITTFKLGLNGERYELVGEYWKI